MISALCFRNTTGPSGYGNEQWAVISFSLQVSACRAGLLPLSQESALIGDVSYHDYNGMLIDAAEKESLVKDLGPVNKVLLLRNHGIVACGETIEEALLLLEHLVLSCETQVNILLRVCNVLWTSNGNTASFCNPQPIMLKYNVKGTFSLNSLPLKHLTTHPLDEVPHFRIYPCLPAHHRPTINVLRIGGVTYALTLWTLMPSNAGIYFWKMNEYYRSLS